MTAIKPISQYTSIDSPRNPEPDNSASNGRGIKLPGSIANKVIPAISSSARRGTASGKPKRPVATLPASPVLRKPSGLSPVGHGASLTPAGSTVSSAAKTTSTTASTSRNKVKTATTSGGQVFFSISSYHRQQIVRSSTTQQPTPRPLGVNLLEGAAEKVQIGTQKVAETAHNVAVEVGKEVGTKAINRTMKEASKGAGKAASKAAGKTASNEAKQFVKHEGRLDSVTSKSDQPHGVSETAQTEVSVEPNRLPDQSDKLIDVPQFTQQAARAYLKAQFGLDIDPEQHYLVQFKPSGDTTGTAADLRQYHAADIERQISLLDLMNDGYGKPAGDDLMPRQGRYGIYSKQAIARGGMITADQPDLSSKPSQFAPFMPVSASEIFADRPHSLLNPKVLIDRMNQNPKQGGYTVAQTFSDYLSKNKEEIVRHQAGERLMTGIRITLAAAKDKSILKKDRDAILRGLSNGSHIDRTGEAIEVASFALGKELSSNGLRIAYDDRVTYYLPGENRPLRSFDSDQSAWDEWLGPMLATVATGDGFLARQFPGTGFGYRQYQRQHSPSTDTFGQKITGNPVREGVLMRIDDMLTEIISSYDRGLRGWD
jgi:hypothetical protein